MSQANKLLELVLKALALAMGVAVTVLTILGQFNPETNILTGIGLFALSLAVLINKNGHIQKRAGV